MARAIVAITLFLWLLLFVVAGPQVACLPLIGLYPGGFVSGDPHYHPLLMKGWAIAMGALLAALGYVAVVRNHRPTALAFAGLFLFAMAVFYARLDEMMKDA